MARTREFDEHRLLDEAIEIFRVSGYQRASLTTLSATTGVANGSLYLAFGNKSGLFLAAFRRYCAKRVQLVGGAVAGPAASPEAVVHNLFGAVLADWRSCPDRRGCLLVNTVADHSAPDGSMTVAAAAIDAMETAVAEALSRALQHDGDERAVPAAARLAISLSQALIQMDRVGRTDPELVDFAVAAARAATAGLEPRAARSVGVAFPGEVGQQRQT